MSSCFVIFVLPHIFLLPLPGDSAAAAAAIGTAAGVAAAGTAGMAIAGGTAAGWNMLGIVAEHLPWIGVAYQILNEIGDIVETKKGMEVLLLCAVLCC